VYSFGHISLYIFKFLNNENMGRGKGKHGPPKGVTGEKDIKVSVGGTDIDIPIATGTKAKVQKTKSVATGSVVVRQDNQNDDDGDSSWSSENDSPAPTSYVHAAVPDGVEADEYMEITITETDEHPAQPEPAAPAPSYAQVVAPAAQNDQTETDEHPAQAEAAAPAPSYAQVVAPAATSKFLFRLKPVMMKLLKQHLPELTYLVPSVPYQAKQGQVQPACPKFTAARCKRHYLSANAALRDETYMASQAMLHAEHVYFVEDAGKLPVMILVSVDYSRAIVKGGFDKRATFIRREIDTPPPQYAHFKPRSAVDTINDVPQPADMPAWVKHMDEQKTMLVQTGNRKCSDVLANVIPDGQKTCRFVNQGLVTRSEPMTRDKCRVAPWLAFPLEDILDAGKADRQGTLVFEKWEDGKEGGKLIDTFEMARKIMVARYGTLSEVEYAYMRSPNSLRIQLKKDCKLDDQWLHKAGLEIKGIKYGSPDQVVRQRKEKRAVETAIIVRDLQERSIFVTRRDGQPIPSEFHGHIARHFGGTLPTSPTFDPFTVMIMLGSLTAVLQLHQKVVALSQQLVLVFTGHKAALLHLPPESHVASA
jgi:hypothetical protein